MAQALQADVTENGVNQGDLVKVLGNIRDVLNEIQADHAVLVTLTTANKTAINAIITAAATNIAAVAGVTPVSAAAVSSLTNSTAITLTKG